MRNFDHAMASTSDSLEHQQGVNRDGKVELRAGGSPCYPRLLAKPGPGRTPACQQRRPICLACTPRSHRAAHASCMREPQRTWRAEPSQDPASI